jgi:signal transduction histidine kinase
LTGVRFVSQNTPTVKPSQSNTDSVRHGWIATVSASGVLLVLIVLFAFTTVWEAKRIYAELSASDEMFQELEVQLAALRGDIYLSGIYIRNQLLNSQGEWGEDQRDSLKQVRASIDHRLGRVEVLVPRQQASMVHDLQENIDHYWRIIGPVAEDPAEAAANGRMIRQQIRSRRDAALVIVEQIGKINQVAYSDRHSQLQVSQTALVNYIWMMMGGVLSLGFVVMVSSGYVVAILNRRAQANRDRIEQTEDELRRLSADLFHTQEQERRVLSRELHDEVGQTLTALGMEIGNIERLHLGSTLEFAIHIDEAKHLTEETLKTVRRLAMGLRPAMLDDSGLAPALRYQAREFSRRTAIRIVVEIKGALENLPDAHRTCIYRVVQEALTNCARHATAKNVRIAVNGDEHRVALRVEDDGVGLADSSPAGLGLIGIGERVRELKGSVSLRPGVNFGTILAVELPVPVNPT